VIYFVEQDRATAEGDEKIRVRATIFPEEMQQQDKGDSTAGK
jgi:lipopolysaccharide export system protein LptA